MALLKIARMAEKEYTVDITSTILEEKDKFG
jgi:hypothetical protein